MSKLVNSEKDRFCTHIKKNGKQCQRILSPKTKYKKCWQHRTFFEIKIFPSRKIKITLNTLFKSIIIIIIPFIIVNIISIKWTWDYLFPKKIFFLTDKYYKEYQYGVIKLNFSLINKDTVRTRIINDIQADILAFSPPGRPLVMIPREKLKSIVFSIFFENQKGLKVSNYKLENFLRLNEGVISLLKKNNAYHLKPGEIFPFSAEFSLEEGEILFRLKIIYIDPPNKKKIIFSDEIYNIKAHFSINRWDTKTFIDNSLNFLKKGSEFPQGNEFLIVALGKLKNKKIISVLIDSLQKYEYDYVTFICITEAIGITKDKRAIEPLVKIVDEDIKKFPWKKSHKLSAIHALVKIGDKSVVPSIKKFFNEENSFRFKIETAQALNRLGENYDITDIIINAINNDNINALAYIAIYEYYNERLVDMLIKKFNKINDYLLKDSLKKTLEEFLLSSSISNSSKNLIKECLKNK